MGDQKTPTMGNGKVCYIEMPAADIKTSASFYQSVFGWNIRTRGDGSVAFDDGVGEVSGTWVRGRPPMTEAGLLIYIMVDSVGRHRRENHGKWRHDCAATRRRRAGNYRAL